MDWLIYKMSWMAWRASRVWATFKRMHRFAPEFVLMMYGLTTIAILAIIIILMK